MPYTIVRQRVKDFPRWRRAFDEHADARQAAGSRGGHIFRVPDDREDVVVFLAWSDMEKARGYLSSAEVREELEAGGVEGEPEVMFLEELARPNL